MPLPTSVIELCQALVQIPSVNPDGDPGTSAENTGEAACAAYIADFLHASGAEVELDEVEPGRPNVIGRFPSQPRVDGNPKPRILFAPHTDTVSVRGMSIPPFGGEVRDGCVWGRGASDTKGPMAAMLWALHQQRHLLPSLPVEVHFAGFMSEESAQLGSQHFAQKHGPYHFALIGEPTELRTVFKHKGCLWVDVHTHGVAVHGSTPEKGVNAIIKMADIIRALDTDFRQQLASGSADPRLGHSTLNLGIIQGGSRSNIVADHCTLRLDLRVIPALEQQPGGVVQKLRDFLSAIDPTATLTVQAHTSALDTAPEHPEIQHLSRCGAELTGAPWFCDAAYLAAAGTPSVAIGPGSIAQAHTRDEFIRCADLEAGAAFFSQYLRSFTPEL
jgi:acetylornithine deacetylase/succinyl-diaminopimelate desuccinylase-like protein